MHPHYRSKVEGCLLGGAVGDALGAPVEFDSLGAIRSRYGDAGITGFVPWASRLGLITDDTQMTLFTCEGLVTAALAGAAGAEEVTAHVYRSYLRWLGTQLDRHPPSPAPSWLGGQDWLYDRRAPGQACVSGLRRRAMGTPVAPANPQSKGCGTVMRAAPFGLQAGKEPPEIFAETVHASVLTHGHPTGYLAAAAFAVIVRALADGASLAEGIENSLALLRRQAGHEETTAALAAARDAVANGTPGPETVESLGGGWIAEEALAIGVYAVLAFPDPGQVRDALLLAVNHSGDADSTGSVCGNILGAWHGRECLPGDLVEAVEGRDTIEQVAADLAAVSDGLRSEDKRAMAERYPLP